MEIANLKTIIGRFSDFSKMPKPELERIDAKDVVARVRALYAARAAKTGRRSAWKPTLMISRCRSWSIRNCCIGRFRIWC